MCHDCADSAVSCVGFSSCPAATKAQLMVQAEPEFLKAAEKHFSVAHVPSEELDETYQTVDVDVLLLRR